MSDPNDLPFWEQRAGGPLTRARASRLRLAEQFRRKRAIRRRPDAHLCERCDGFTEDFGEPCFSCGARQAAGPEEAAEILVRDAGLSVRVIGPD